MFTVYLKTGTTLTAMVKADTYEEALDAVSKLGPRLCIIDQDEEPSAAITLKEMPAIAA